MHANKWIQIWHVSLYHFPLLMWRAENQKPSTKWLTINFRGKCYLIREWDNWQVKREPKWRSAKAPTTLIIFNFRWNSAEELSNIKKIGSNFKHKHAKNITFFNGSWSLFSKTLFNLVPKSSMAIFWLS